MTPRMQVLSGYLLGSIDGLPVESGALVTPNGLSFIRTLGSTKWEEYELVSTAPLLNETQMYGLLPPFKYSVFAIRDADSVTLLSSARAIIQALLYDGQFGRLSALLLRMNVAVSGLIRHLIRESDIYTLSFAHARTGIYGARLQTMSFYGEDIARAAIFTQAMEVADCFTCGLRHSRSGLEALRISNSGHVSCLARQASGGPLSALTALLAALGFVSGNGFIRRPAPGPPDEFGDALASEGSQD